MKNLMIYMVFLLAGSMTLVAGDGRVGCHSWICGERR